MIKFRCIECQHKIAVPNDYEGRYVKCPACSGRTLVRSEPIQVQTTAAVASSGAIGARAAVRTRVLRHAVPPSPSRQPHMPEARPVGHGSAAGLAASQASELIKALDHTEESGPAAHPEALSLSLDPAPVSARPEAPAQDSHVPHASPPQYLFLHGLGYALIAMGAATLMLWLVGLVLALSGSKAPGLAMPGGPAGVLTFAAGFIAILGVLACGQSLLALRDIARNSWYHKETAALVRHLQQ